MGRLLTSGLSQESTASPLMKNGYYTLRSLAVPTLMVDFFSSLIMSPSFPFDSLRKNSSHNFDGNERWVIHNQVKDLN